MLGQLQLLRRPCAALPSRRCQQLPGRQQQAATRRCLDAQPQGQGNLLRRCRHHSQQLQCRAATADASGGTAAASGAAAAAAASGLASPALEHPPQPKRLAVFVSGGGSNLRALHAATQDGHINGRIEVIVGPRCVVIVYLSRTHHAPMKLKMSKTYRWSSQVTVFWVFDPDTACTYGPLPACQFLPRTHMHPIPCRRASRAQAVAEGSHPAAQVFTSDGICPGAGGRSRQPFLRRLGLCRCARDQDAAVPHQEAPAGAVLGERRSSRLFGSEPRVC